MLPESRNLVKYMVDIFSKEKRSKIMSSIKSKNTSIDKKIESLLKSAKIKFKMYPKMVGNPDFIITDRKVAIFCDGDFWHGYDYKTRKDGLPEFWRNKIENNMKRDKKNNFLLKTIGWKVIRLWEHEIIGNPKKCLEKII